MQFVEAVPDAELLEIASHNRARQLWWTCWITGTKE